MTAPRLLHVAGPKPSTTAIKFRHVSEIVAESREPEWLIHKVIEANVLAVLAGPRGSFKSFIALDWAMRMAVEGHAGVVLSGEGSGLDRRVGAWINQHRLSTDLASLPLVALERCLNLTDLAELDAVREAVQALPKQLGKPEFMVIDTLSKFAIGLDENDNGDVAAFLSNLSAVLREDLGCTVILVAHSGHSDSARPRGASTLMANPDAEYIVSRPDPRGMFVTVTRDRFKDAASMPPLSYEAKVIDLGRHDRYGEAVTSLALVMTDAPLSFNAKGRGKNQDKVIVALREWQRTNPQSTLISSIDLRAICKAQGVNRKREREVLDTFCNVRILTPSIGGFTIHAENL